MVVCLVPLNGEEVPIQAEGVLVVAVEEASLLFLDAIGEVLRVGVDIDRVS